MVKLAHQVRSSRLIRLAITHIFPCSINGLLASLKGVSFCAEPFECPPFRVILSGSNIDRGRNYNCPCGWSKMWVIASLPGGIPTFLAVTIVAFVILGSVLEGIPAIVLFGPL